MNDVRGDFLGPPHGTTPAAVIVNKKILDPLEAVKQHAIVTYAYWA